MFVDYLTVMLLNLVAGLVLIACWIFADFGRASQQRWVVGFLMTAVLALATGLHMTLTWPLPGSFNIVFGEMGLLFGILMLGLTVAVRYELDLLPIAVYATFVGLAGIILGVEIIDAGLTKHPIVSGISFIVTGVIGLFAVPMYFVRRAPVFQIIATVGLVIAAILWAITAFNAYYGHVHSFSDWRPNTILERQAP